MNVCGNCTRDRFYKRLLWHVSSRKRQCMGLISMRPETERAGKFRFLFQVQVSVSEGVSEGVSDSFEQKRQVQGKLSNSSESRGKAFP